MDDSGRPALTDSPIPQLYSHHSKPCKTRAGCWKCLKTVKEGILYIVKAVSSSPLLGYFKDDLV